MCSVTEPKAQNYCLKLGGNIIAYTHRNMMRVYPNKTRTNSSNFDPLWAWGCGVQMVALNHQTPGRMMDLNRGVFKQNGNCGYVLKPKCILPKTNPHGPERYGSSVRVQLICTIYRAITSSQICRVAQYCTSTKNHFILDNVRVTICDTI